MLVRLLVLRVGARPVSHNDDFGTGHGKVSRNLRRHLGLRVLRTKIGTSDMRAKFQVRSRDGALGRGGNRSGGSTMSHCNTGKSF